MLARSISLSKVVGRWLYRPQLHGCGCLASVMAAALALVVIVVLGEYTKTRGLLLLTAVIVAGYFLLGMWMWTVTVGRTLPRTWTAQLGLGVTTIAMALMLAAAWAAPGAYALWKVAGALTVLALASTHCGWLLDGRTPRLLVRAAIGLTALVGVMAVFGIAAGTTASIYWWAFVLLTVLWLVSTVVIAIFAIRVPGNPQGRFANRPYV